MEENKTNIFKPKTFSASVKNSGLNDFIFLIDLKEDTCSISEDCAKFIQIPSANFPIQTPQKPWPLSFTKTTLRFSTTVWSK